MNELLNTIHQNNAMIDELITGDRDDDDKVFFPYGGDSYDFSPKNLLKFMTESRIKELQTLIDMTEKGANITDILQQTIKELKSSV